jgi:hypothetical protein
MKIVFRDFGPIIKHLKIYIILHEYIIILLHMLNTEISVFIGGNLIFLRCIFLFDFSKYISSQKIKKQLFSKQKKNEIFIIFIRFDCIGKLSFNQGTKITKQL